MSPIKYKNEDNSDDEFLSKKNKLKTISKVFENYGGVLAKLSQLLCMDEQNDSSFSKCQPYSKDKTIE